MNKQLTMKIGPQKFDHRHEKGFTLVELMVALAISGIVMAAISFSFLSQRRMSVTQDAVVDMQQNIRASLLVMGNELRMAGYNPKGNCSNTGFATVEDSKVSFIMCADDDGDDNDNDGTKDEPGETKQITYDLYDAYNTIDRQVGTPTPALTEDERIDRILAENIEKLYFNYIDSAGNSTTNVNDIRSVQISILARSHRDDMPVSQSTTYSPISSVVWTYNDNIRRIFLSTTINCRNMGL